jgi:predicted dinucleotide-binding enzyme
VLLHPEISHDVLVAGGAIRKPDVMELIRSMHLHPIDAGPIEVAGHLERMTVLLLSINRANKVKESGIKITGI